MATMVDWFFKPREEDFFDPEEWVVINSSDCIEHKSMRRWDILDAPLRPTRLLMNQEDWDDIVKWSKE